MGARDGGADDAEEADDLSRVSSEDMDASLYGATIEQRRGLRGSSARRATPMLRAARPLAAAADRTATPSLGQRCGGRFATGGWGSAAASILRNPPFLVRAQRLRVAEQRLAAPAHAAARPGAARRQLLWPPPSAYAAAAARGEADEHDPEQEQLAVDRALCALTEAFEVVNDERVVDSFGAVSYTHLTLPTILLV